MATQVNTKDGFSILHSTLPECVPGRSPAYSVPQDDSTRHAYTDGFATTPHPPSTQRRWIRWPVLVVASVLIALIAGIIGGFIGKAIESHKLPHTSYSPNANSDPTHAPTSTCSATNTTQPTTVPATGCPKDSQNSQNLISTIARVSYTLICNVDWVGNDLVGIPARSGSECVEACDTWNQFQTKGNFVNKTCVGASWVPAWSVNLTAGFDEVGQPSSCFLKYQIAGLPGPKIPFDVVGLCLNGNCPS